MASESDHKVEPKMVRESDLMAVRRREEKLKEEVAELKGDIANLTSELSVAKVDGEDSEEVKRVKDFLLAEEKRINKLMQDHEKEVASFNEREKESRVKALASQYQIEIADIESAEDPEKEALRIVNERLTKEKEVPKEPENPAEETFESSVASGQIKKKFADMTDEEFKQAEEQMKAEYYNKPKA